MNQSQCGRLLVLCFAGALSAGCSTVERRADAIVGTPFQNGGLSTKSRELLQTVEAMKGAVPQRVVEDAKNQLALDFSSVVAQCKESLDSNDSKLQRSNNWALGASIVGLVAGIGGSAFAAKASASKSTIAALSGIAGGTNSLQNQLKQSGYDPVEYAKRSSTIRETILAKTKEFQDGDLERQQAALRDLVATCVAYS